MQAEISPPEKSPHTASFEVSLQELGGVVSKLEGGSLGLADSIAIYEQGVLLLRQLHVELESVKQRVVLLTHIDPLGQASIETMPTPAQSASLKTSREEPTHSVTRKRRPQKDLPGMDDGSHTN